MINFSQFSTLSWGNLVSLLILLVVVAFIIFYRRTVLAGFILFGRSVLFTLKYPAVLIFALIRLLIFAVLDIAISAWFYPEMGWKNFMSQPLQKIMNACYVTCLPGIQCGYFILFLFFAIGILISIATIHYVLARIKQQVEPSPYSINIALQNWRPILILSLLYSSVYLGIITKQLYLLPAMLLLTFFTSASMAQGANNVASALIRSIKIMKANLGKAVTFVFIFGVIGLIFGVGTLQMQQFLVPVLYSLIALLVTIRDIFKALVAYQMAPEKH